ncbi:MAG: GNAT family N-acetyltransferase [Solirubrobacteraceae bacterium]
MTNRAAIERFDPARHDVAAFDCGNEALNRWLTRSAGQSDRRDAARTFVTSAAGVVVGYYALLAGQLEHQAATAIVRSGQSRHFPIPVAILARLAVDADHQHRGVGAALLRDALIRIQSAAAHVAVRAVIVHAIDDQAAAFYARYGFRAVTATPRTLMVTLAELRASAEPSPNT